MKVNTKGYVRGKNKNIKSVDVSKSNSSSIDDLMNSDFMSGDSVSSVSKKVSNRQRRYQDRMKRSGLRDNTDTNDSNIKEAEVVSNTDKPKGKAIIRQVDKKDEPKVKKEEIKQEPKKEKKPEPVVVIDNEKEEARERLQRSPKRNHKKAPKPEFLEKKLSASKPIIKKKSKPKPEPVENIFEDEDIMDIIEDPIKEHLEEVKEDKVEEVKEEIVEEVEEEEDMDEEVVKSKPKRRTSKKAKLKHKKPNKVLKSRHKKLPEEKPVVEKEEVIVEETVVMIEETVAEEPKKIKVNTSRHKKPPKDDDKVAPKEMEGSSVSSNITWTIEVRRAEDLHRYELNPRKISKRQRDELRKSIKKFGYNQYIVVNTDNTIISGHQRYDILTKDLGYTEMACYVPNRTLTNEEVKELCVRANRNTGEFDYALLGLHFDVDDLISWGMDEIKEKTNPITVNPDIEHKEIVKDSMTHYLISLPTDLLPDVQRIVDKLRDFEEVYIDQASD